MTNLQAAFTGETTASAKYAAFGQQARKEGHANIALLFEAASKAEAIHAANHKAALEQLGEKAPDVKPEFNESKVSTLPSQYQVCTTCGNTYDNSGPARCALCMTSNERFVTFK